MTKAWAALLTATCFFIGGGMDYALASSISPFVAPISDHNVVMVNCKQGEPHCTTLPRNYPVHGKNTLQNIGDCQGSTNDTCGLKTPYVRHKPVTAHPVTVSSKSHK